MSPDEPERLTASRPRHVLGGSTGEGVRRGWRTLLWQPREIGESRGGTFLLRFLRTVAVLFRDVVEGQLVLRAMSLVYTTLLSLVPLLALSFSVLKGFGVHNQSASMLRAFLAPLGEDSDEITHRIISFIDNMSVGVLGSLGLSLLLYTAVSLLYKVEESFNFIWHLPRSRTFGERFSRYLTLLLVGPLLVFSALGITATATNTDIARALIGFGPFDQLFVILSRLAPYLLVIAAFSFAYYFIPNTRVHPSAAIVGGIVAGVAWQTTGWVFAAFVAESGSYEAIYSGFAILILFLIWLYLSWMILLLGASVAFYVQHPAYLVARAGDPELSNRMRERLGLAIMAMIAQRFLHGRAPLDADGMARRLGVPAHVVGMVLGSLEAQRLVTGIGDNPHAFLPARDLAAIPIQEILQAVRSAGEEDYLTVDALALPPRVEDVVTHIDESVAAALGDASLRDIAGDEAEPYLTTGDIGQRAHGDY